MNTINGKSIDNIKELISGPFDKELLQFRADNSKRPYFPKEVYYDRINSVISKYNYSFKVTQIPQLQVIHDTYGYACVVELYVYFDSGELCHEFSTNGLGYYDIIFFQDSKNPKSIEDNMRSCITRAKKDALRNLIGEASYASNYLEQKQVVGNKLLIKMHHEFKESSNMYYAIANTVDDDVPLKLIIWKNSMGEISDKAMKHLRSSSIVESVFFVIGTPKNYNGEQQFIVSKVQKRGGK